MPQRKWRNPQGLPQQAMQEIIELVYYFGVHDVHVTSLWWKGTNIYHTGGIYFFALSSETTIECYVSVAPIYHDSLVARYAQ